MCDNFLIDPDILKEAKRKKSSDIDKSDSNQISTKMKNYLDDYHSKQEASYDDYDQNRKALKKLTYSYKNEEREHQEFISSLSPEDKIRYDEAYTSWDEIAEKFEKQHRDYLDNGSKCYICQKKEDQQNKNFYITEPTLSEQRYLCSIALDFFENDAPYDNLRVICPQCCSLIDSSFYYSVPNKLSQSTLLKHFKHIQSLNTNKLLNNSPAITTLIQTNADK